MSQPEARFGGVVLCGGRSSRMGTAKALLTLEGRTFLEIVVETLTSVVAPIVVVAAAEQELPPLPDSCLVVHDVEEYRGPLAGMQLGLETLRTRTEVNAAYVSGCDVPLLSPAWVRHMCGLLRDADLVVPREDRFHHPLAGVYGVDLALAIRDLIAAERMRPVFLFDNHEGVFPSVESLRTIDPELDSLRNVNTPEEYAAVCELWRSRTR